MLTAPIAPAPVALPTFQCCLCCKHSEGYGNNPAPLITSADARCCDKCNAIVVFCRMGMSRPNATPLNRRNWVRLIRAESPELAPIYAMFAHIYAHAH